MTPRQSLYFFTSLGLSLSLLSIIEFSFSLHPFVDAYSHGESFNVWSAIQSRGGLDRSEWSFGHSIALGNAIALAIPFAWRLLAGKRAVSTVVLAILIAGATCTFSRNSLLAVAVSLCACVLLSKSGDGRSPRGYAKLLAVVLGGVASFWGLSKFNELGGSETTASTGARMRQWTLLDYVEPLGRSDAYVTLYDGRGAYILSGRQGGFTDTVDNSILSLALQVGWVPAILIFLVPVILISRQLFTWRIDASGIAIAGQLFTLLSVALITQWALLYWMVVGVCASFTAAGPERPERVNHVPRQAQGVLE